jgi:hypothetical protein
MWEFLLGIGSVLVVLVVAGIALWSSLKKGYAAYLEGQADGTWTDEEKLRLADCVLSAVVEAKNLWSFILKLIQMFKDRKK